MNNVNGVNSISDIAIELRERYSESVIYFKKGEKGKLFERIVKELFILYGSTFGFENLSDFESSIVRAKNSLRNKKRKFFSRECIKEVSEYEGEEYLNWQIANLDLNPDSYY